MNVESVLEAIAQAAVNYIVVSTISSSNQKQTVTDLKTDLRTTKEDLMAEIKDSKESVLAKIETDTTAEVEIFKTHFESQQNQNENMKGN